MLEISVDWLQFTSHKNSPLDIIIRVLLLDVKLFTQLPKGKLGYRKQIYYENISILYDGTEDMGVHVIMSGKGCRLYESYHSILGLITRLNENEIKCTRVDLALDDKQDKLIPFKTLIKDVRSGNVVSKWKSSTEFTKRNLSDGEIIGQTIYIGSRQSAVFMRIYDKALQLQLEERWIRMEIEVKSGYAQALQKKMTKDNIGSLTKSIINNYFRIVKPGEDSNKSRWETKKYWQKLIDTAEKTSLSENPEEPTIEKSRNWLKKQVSTTMATICIADGGSLDFLDSLVAEGQKKMTSKHLNMIDKENEKCLIE